VEARCFVKTPGGPKTTAVGTVHWGADNQQDARKATGDFTAWHTYAVEWRPTFDWVRIYR
jgi:hypothetical protein